MSELNKNACGGCIHFDRISPRSSHGRCADRSVYPHEEQPGQSFPEGAARAGAGELARPFVVSLKQVVTGCTKYRAA